MLRMQFDFTETDEGEGATEAVAPGTSSSIGPCGGIDPYECICPNCGYP